MESQTRANVYLTRNDFMGYEDLNLSFGINNITDEEPPLADTTFGYDGSLHSSSIVSMRVVNHLLIIC
ncbi:hypothetical protein ND16A_3232 [Thalassotalea sp. ND16A]|nr:hypothetical protein ND16A_3232 [Thalassotalea sp. ND16A]